MNEEELEDLIKKYNIDENGAKAIRAFNTFLDITTDPHFVGSKTRKIVEEKVFEKPIKPKPVNYNTELKIRISSKQKDALAKISSSYGLTMSQYVRELIEKDLYSD